MGKPKKADPPAPEPEPEPVPQAEPPLKGDALLRSRGFHVHARPKLGPALWERNGRVVWETAALDIAAREAAAIDQAIKESSE